MIEKTLEAIENITGPLSDHQRADIREQVVTFALAVMHDTQVQQSLLVDCIDDPSEADDGIVLASGVSEKGRRLYSMYEERFGK